MVLARKAHTRFMNILMMKIVVSFVVQHNTVLVKEVHMRITNMGLGQTNVFFAVLHQPDAVQKAPTGSIRNRSTAIIA